MTSDLRLKVLKTMIRIRLVEQYIAQRYPEQQMKCPTHLCIGQEAAAAVFGNLVTTDDVFMGTYRSHGHYLAKGGSLKKLFAELLGKPNGCAKGFGGSMHLIDPELNFMGTSAIVASGVPIAAGAAFAQKYRKKNALTVVFFGDAAMEEGIVYETANFALLHKLPLIMVCENNRLAISTPIEQRQASLSLHNRFESMGLRGYTIAENDLSSLIAVAQKELEDVRSGHGPAFIEYRVSRWSGHVGHDIKGPVDNWANTTLQEANCPIAIFLKKLIDEKQITIDEVSRIRQETIKEIEAAYGLALTEPAYETIELTGHVFASSLRAQLPSQESAASLEHSFKSQAPSKLVNPF